MTILFAGITRHRDLWLSELQRRLPDDEVVVWPEVGDPAAVEFLVCWHFDLAETASFTGLRGVLLSGAGVNHLDTAALAADVPLVRLADPNMAADMARFARVWVEWLQLGMHRYRAQQIERSWAELPVLRPADHRVGVLGLGEIGRTVATELVRAGFAVRGWSRSGSPVDGIEVFGGPEALHECLRGCDAVVNVLPLTAATAACIDAGALAVLPEDAVLINIGRAGTIDHDAVVEALGSGRLGGAVLDVMDDEPLPPESPLWDVPGLVITPHISGLTDAKTAVELIATNIERIRAGVAPRPVVDRSTGY